MSEIEAVASHLREAERILFVTGAGLSADSGLPTYRGVGGLYDTSDEGDVGEASGGLPIEAVLSGGMFRLHRELAAGFDVVLSVGTSSGFPYIAAPILLQVQQGRPAVEINPGLTDVSEVVTHRLAGRAAVVLDELGKRCSV